MHIYAILGTKMAAIQPSWVGSGKGWCRKMRIRPEYDFGRFTKWPDSIVFELRTNYAILGAKMAAIRPSWVGSGKGW